MKKVVVDGVKYGIREREAIVVGHVDPSQLDLIIPAEVNSVPVTAIRKEAFMNSNIRTLCLPDTIVYIHDMAVKNCKNLISVSEYESGKQTHAHHSVIICDCAFEDCVNLQSFDFNSTVKYVSNNAFAGCEKLADMHAMLVTVRKNAFQNCYALEELSFGLRARLYNQSIEESGVKTLRVYNSLECPNLLLKHIKQNQIAIYCAANSDLIDLAYMGYNVGVNDKVFA